MSQGIANIIADFSVPVAPEGFGIGMLRPAKPAAQAVQQDHVRVPTAADRQAELIHAIEARVRSEEKEVARRQLKEALEAEQEKHREEMALQRERWVEQEAAQLSAQIVAAIGNLEQVLSDRVARILASLIPEALRHNAIAEFKEILGTVLSGEGSALLRVTGPEDMLNAIRACLALQDEIIEFVPSDAVEVTLMAGDTTIQTQLGSWSARLQEALKAD